MNAIPNNPRLPRVSLALLVALVALAPYAMSFQPCASYTTDAIHPRRIVLVLFGLGATGIALAEFIMALRRLRLRVVAIAPFAAAFLACAVVGWRSYPYWVAGVYQVSIGASPWVGQDPKGLVPMMWIGELWRLPVMLVYLLCYAGIPFLSLIGMLALGRRQLTAAGVILFCTGVTLVFMFDYSPFYVAWLMD